MKWREKKQTHEKWIMSMHFSLRRPTASESTGTMCFNCVFTESTRAHFIKKYHFGNVSTWKVNMGFCWMMLEWDNQTFCHVRNIQISNEKRNFFFVCAYFEYLEISLRKISRSKERKRYLKDRHLFWYTIGFATVYTLL